MTTDTPVTAPRNAGTTGRISLVGIGPGHTDHMTARARAAIAEADVVIGYVTYIKLVADLLDGKEVMRKGMTEELDRAVTRWPRPAPGKKVALISSGDAGVYGMAGPTYEVLFQAGWTPEDHVAVEIVPGASAINACAALVGAPLTHDFCSISLSDLLTPWPVIARAAGRRRRGRLRGGALQPKERPPHAADRRGAAPVPAPPPPDTPVAIVKSAYRRRQHIVHTTLDQMAEQEIGMLSTVLIGNSSTFLREGLMVTPRGYANKYDVDQGFETREGEKAGRSLSSGLLGWIEGLRAEHAAGAGLVELASRHRLPADYIAQVLAAPDAHAPAEAGTEETEA
jgi:precorrin-3B C17-methyltransferase